MRSHVTYRHVAVGEPDEIIDCSELLDLFLCRHQRAGRNVQRIRDVATKDVRADQPGRVQVLPTEVRDRLVVYVVRLVQKIRGYSRPEASASIRLALGTDSNAAVFTTLP
jgi:hypothetical protein